MGTTEEGQHTVLAHAEELDILDQDHLIVFDVKERSVHQFERIDFLTTQCLIIHPGDTIWCAHQPLARGIFAGNTFQDLADGLLNILVLVWDRYDLGMANTIRSR